MDKQQDTQTRITALWTLEGCSAVSENLLTTLLADTTPRIQTHAIRVAEAFVKENNTVVVDTLAQLGNTTHPEVAVQLLNTIYYCGTPEPLASAASEIIKEHGNVEAVAAVNNREKKRLADEQKAKEARLANEKLAKTMERGQVTYQQLCFSCHGNDGKGQPLAGQEGHFLAPSFVGSPRVLGSGEAISLAILHGMEGPIDGKTYDGLMPAQESNTDEYIADVATYIRNSFGNKAPEITPKQVADVRKKHSGRAKAWTQEELDKIEKLKGSTAKK